MTEDEYDDPEGPALRPVKRKRTVTPRSQPSRVKKEKREHELPVVKAEPDSDDFSSNNGKSLWQSFTGPLN